MENNKFQTFKQDFIPFRKRLEYIRKERDFLNDKNNKPNTDDVEEFQAEFVAGLFEDERVTKDAILDGLDMDQAHVIPEIIAYQLLGVTKEETASDNGEEKGK